MTSPVTLLLSGLGLVAAIFVFAWWRSATTGGHPHPFPTLRHLGLGTVTMFFDTLGIGSYAPLTAAFRMLRMVRDELIPGTLNVGNAVPVALEAFAFIVAITVDPVTLLLVVAIGAAGGYFGAGIVAGLPARAIQFGMGGALLIGATVMFLTNMQWLPGGGTATGLSGTTLVAAATINFVLGAFNALGIGTYAPSLIAFSLLGMDPRAAFPIMGGSAAYMQAFSGLRFVRRGRYDGQASLGIALGGIPGVLVAAYIVKSLPLTAIRWLVVVVVLYASISLLRTAWVARTE